MRLSQGTPTASDFWQTNALQLNERIFTKTPRIAHTFFNLNHCVKAYSILIIIEVHSHAEGIRFYLFVFVVYYRFRLWLGWFAHSTHTSC
jgi:hypothetical protein